MYADLSRADWAESVEASGTEGGPAVRTWHSTLRAPSLHPFRISSRLGAGSPYSMNASEAIFWYLGSSPSASFEP